MILKILKLKKETFGTLKYQKFTENYKEFCRATNNNVEEWQNFLELQEINFKKVRFEEKSLIIEEEGYIEPTPDPMMTYMGELGTFNNIKSTHELGLISDEEMEECNNYMKSLYPNERTRMMKLEKPELFEKFRSHR